nr:VCBS repeat-containing protein [Bacteroidota bacterium]
MGTKRCITNGPVVNDGGKSVGAAWADYDLDGQIDLYVVNRDQKNFLYRGLGAGEFEKITTGEIANDIANSSGCAWGDYDNDAYPDLYVANSGTASCLYRNNQDGTFSKVVDEPFATDVSKCSGASWGDADNDGDMDLFVSTGQLGMYENWFYINNGDGSFTKITDSPLVNDATWSSGSAWGDYDKDGDLDLAVGGYDGDNLLFNNDGSGNFTKVEDNEFVNDGSYTEGLAWADIDDDGDLDIFTAKNNYFSGNNSLFLNNGNNNNWLKVRIEIEQNWHNVNGIGSRIYMYATVFGQPLMQMREVSAQTGGGQGGQNELIQFFGLGDADVVDSLVVFWNYGIKYIETGVAINQTRELYLSISDIDEIENQGSGRITAFPNPALEQVTFNIALKVPSKSLISICDLKGRLVKVILNGKMMEDGQEIVWDLKNQEGDRVHPGVYFCRYVIGEETGTKKIVVSRLR